MREKKYRGGKRNGIGGKRGERREKEEEKG